MFPGDTILCRAYRNQPLVRRVWSIAEDGILICTDESFRLWEEEKIEPIVVKAPFDAVYKYDEHLFRQLHEAFQSSGNDNPRITQLWYEAEPYSG